MNSEWLAAAGSHLAGAGILPRVDELDQAVFSEGSCFNMGEKEEADFRLRVVRGAVETHLLASPVYAQLAERLGFRIEMLESPADLARVPVLPTGLFKRTTVTSKAGGPVLRTFLSSGTNGAISEVRRDETTLQRLLGSVRSGLTLLDRDDIADLSESQVFNLGPSRAAAGDIWFSYVMALVELVAETRHYVVDGELRLAEAADDIRRTAETDADVFVVGPPVFVARLAERLAVDDVPLNGPRITVVTGGGWKARDNQEQIGRRNFAKQIASAFALPGTGRIRDIFNQVELNSVLVECGLGFKHAPPWLFVCSRDSRLRPLADGEPGLLSYLDPTATSYPCLFIGDDIGRVFFRRCDCGRAGQTVVFERRLDRTADVGCALKMDGRYSPRQSVVTEEKMHDK